MFKQFLTSVAIMSVAILGATPLRAQVDKLPRYLQETLAQLGPRYERESQTAIPATVEAFQSILKASPKDGITVIPNQAYGADLRQVLDVYAPTARTGAPVVIFVHGGAYTASDKDIGEPYGNVAIWFARQGMLGINANYRLAPFARWPAGVEDVRGMVAWAKANVARYGGDPSRIFLVGHSAGATHVSGYVFDKTLQPAEGTGIAGAVLISGRYRLVYNPADPFGRNMRAYFGDDPAQYENRSTITHIRDGARVPVFIVIAEYEQPGLDVLGGELLSALCQRDGACPRFVRLNGHNHMSEILAFNTQDEYLGREILDFMARGR
jgi:acetyl esterase/lipase